jgi:hypothetical protein
MTTTAPPIVRCPVCGAHGSMLHHDIRGSLVYSCKKCLHEWQIDPADEPPKPVFESLEDPPRCAARGKGRAAPGKPRKP